MASPKTFQDLLASKHEASHVLSWVKPFLLAVLVSSVAQRLMYSLWSGTEFTEASFMMQANVSMVLKAIVFTGVFCWFAPQGVKDRNTVLTELFVLFSWYMVISYLIQLSFTFGIANVSSVGVLPTVLGIAAGWGTLYAYRQIAVAKA